MREVKALHEYNQKLYSDLVTLQRQKKILHVRTVPN